MARIAPLDGRCWSDILSAEEERVETGLAIDDMAASGKRNDRFALLFIFNAREALSRRGADVLCQADHPIPGGASMRLFVDLATVVTVQCFLVAYISDGGARVTAMRSKESG